MAIAKRLSRANRIASNENNIVTGKLSSVDAVTSEIVNQQTGEIVEIEQIEWCWSVPTAIGKDTTIHEWTGLTVNSEKTWHPEDGSPASYNKLTTILIKSGLIDEKDIDGSDLENIDIESLIGKEFEFELERRNKKRNIKSIKLNTLKLIG